MVLLRRSALTLAAAAGLALSAALTAPAEATAPSAAVAYPTTPVDDVNYGATYVRGTLTWYDRSVGITGTYRAIATSGCRRVWVGTYDAAGKPLDARSTSTLCDGVKPIDFAVPADVPGGAAQVLVCLDDENAEPLKCVLYERP
ncbi:hypothetical protein [Streptomyces lancefieldiae]|uniref:Secreted protein n=1 Tax=Streptomyces lancefieldiae TaxID=3075520 RepID=A0ABU3AFZ5_9ACTN|nr:hypothetical protein [Streptomyces sp. DSM 40712]MDT0609096.1 hypothetical protein [Streptomyces sp. DSM 40712]